MMVLPRDPHPGNLFYLEDGRVALIDCGMVGSFGPALANGALTEPSSPLLT